MRRLESSEKSTPSEIPTIAFSGKNSLNSNFLVLVSQLQKSPPLGKSRKIYIFLSFFFAPALFVTSSSRHLEHEHPLFASFLHLLALEKGWNGCDDILLSQVANNPVALSQKLQALSQKNAGEGDGNVVTLNNKQMDKSLFPRKFPVI